MKRVIWDRVMSALYSNSVWSDDVCVGECDDENVLLVSVELVVKLLYELCPPEFGK